MLNENLFLIVLALIWIVVAIVMDYRKREVQNWWNFSLIAIALVYRAFTSLYLRDYRFFIYGVIGFAIFFIIANLFYYSRVFAGGDAKLLMALGAILPFSSTFFSNLIIFLYFIFLLLFFGGIYGMFFSLFLAVRNSKKFTREFSRQFEKNKRLIEIIFIIVIVLSVLFLLVEQYLLVAFPMLLLIFPFLYIYAKSVEESCMIKSVDVKNLTVGDWLYEEVRIGKRKIKPNWEGLNERELRLLQKKQGKGKVKIKQGIPFTPAFLFAFLILIWLLF